MSSNEVCRSCMRCQDEGCTEAVRHINPAALHILDQGKTSCFYQRGDELYQQGSVLPGLYCISTARLKLTTLTAGGKAQMLGVAGPGELLGITSVFSGQPVSHTAEALSSGVVCLFPLATVRAALEVDPELSMNLVSSVSRLQVSTEARLMALAGLSAPARIAQLILEAPTSRLNRTEMAQMAGTTLETVSRLVQQLSRQGILALSGRRVTILRREELEDLVRRG